MITCKDLNIELCKGCDHPDQYCYIRHYKIFIDTYCPTTKDIIELYKNICNGNTSDIMYVYFTKVLEIYNPEILKLMILI